VDTPEIERLSVLSDKCFRSTHLCFAYNIDHNIMIRNIPAEGSVLLPPRSKKTSTRGGVKRRRGGVGTRVLVGSVVIFIGIIANVVYMHTQIVNAHLLSPRHPSSSTASFREMVGDRSPSSFAEVLGTPASSSSSSLEDRGKVQDLPEIYVFQRLEKEFENTWEVCRNASTSATHTMLRGKEEQRSLAPPAFLRALHDFTSPNSTSQDGKIHGSCSAPSNSSSVDQSSNYIMLFPTVSQDLRSIFLHCMKWLMDPAVAEIWLIVPDETRDLMHKDVPYGNRILAWNHRKKHRVHVASAPTLWKAVAQVDEAASRSVSAVFWVNDEAWLGNHRGIHAGWELWKQDTSALVAARGWGLPGGTSQKEGSRQDLQGTTLTTICPRDSMPSVVALTNSNDMPSFVDLIGSFHHRDYLCFLRHPVLASLQADVHDWRDMQWVMAWWLAQVTGRSPRTFPPRIKNEQEINMQSDHSLSITQAAQDVAKDGQGDTLGPQQSMALLVSYFGGVTIRTH
jgi:hypothetical protein